MFSALPEEIYDYSGLITEGDYDGVSIGESNDEKEEDSDESLLITNGVDRDALSWR